jgi:magnesium chelatase subunit H
MICCMSGAEVMKLTRMGRFTMDGEAKGPVALLKRLRGKNGKAKSSAGAQQLTVLRQLPKILRFIPGTAQDVRAYFLTLQYWLAGLRREHARMMASSSTATPTASARPCAGTLEHRGAGGVPGVGLYDPGRRSADLRRNVASCPRAAQAQGHRRRADHALLRAGRKHASTTTA